MMDWLLAPIDASRAHDITRLVSWHARAMVLAWAVLVPLGIISARYFKVTPRQNWPERLDNRAWWVAHRALQYSAGGAILLAVGLILSNDSRLDSVTSTLWMHVLLGWAVVVLAGVQFTSALLRGSKGGPSEVAAKGTLRGDHFDMTARRKIFEYVHKFGGVLAAILSVVTILTGLWQANAPHWMWLGILGWWGCLAVVVVYLERRMGAFDTYQAIWGPDPDLPGNKIAPIGMAVRRSEK
jgi:uncharacterized membrane protein